MQVLTAMQNTPNVMNDIINGVEKGQDMPIQFNPAVVSKKAKNNYKALISSPSGSSKFLINKRASQQHTFHVHRSSKHRGNHKSKDDKFLVTNPYLNGNA